MFLIALVAAPLAAVLMSGCQSQSSVDPLPPTAPSSTSVYPDPSPTDSGSTGPGRPVCDNLTEIGNDLNTLQFGPADNEYQELTALGSLLSLVQAGTSQQSTDLGNLVNDYNTTVTDSGDGSSQDQSAILNGISNMNGDFNALQSDCPGA